MIPHGVEIFVAREPVNMRLSFDRLAGLAEIVTGRPARRRALFVFFGKRRDAIKVLYADETGLCIFYKRLDKGRFQIPEVEPGQDSVEISESELDELLEGLALESRNPRRRKGPTMH